MPVSPGQRAAAAAPELKSTVASVENDPFYALATWKDGTWSKKPVEFSQIRSDRPYHDTGSGKFFVHLSDALAVEWWHYGRSKSSTERPARRETCP